MEGAVAALALLACPVGMGLMMWFMSRGKKEGSEEDRPSLDELRAEHQRISSEIERYDQVDGAGNDHLVRR